MSLVTTNKKCSRNCGRCLFDAELSDGVCSDCLKENTVNKKRCNGCGTIGIFTGEQLCSKCIKPGNAAYCKTCKTPLHAPESVKTGMCIQCTPSKQPVGFYKGGASGTAVDKCNHIGSPEVFKHGKGTVYAGGDRDEDEWTLHDKDIALLVSCKGSPFKAAKTESCVEVNAEAKALLPKAKYASFYPPPPKIYPTLYIDWSDGGTPPWGIEEKFALGLLDYVKAGNNIMVFCMGGHGRTGTMLSWLVHLAGINKADPVAWVRKNYCEKAVETAKQIEWLVAKGVKTKEDFSWSTTSLADMDTSGMSKKDRKKLNKAIAKASTQKSGDGWISVE